MQANIHYIGARHNDLDSIMLDAIMAMTLQHFEEKATMLKYINVDASDGESAIGETVHSPLPVVFGEAGSLERGGRSVASPINQQTAPVNIDQLFYVEFMISDREYSTAMADGVPSRGMIAAADAMGRKFNQMVRDLVLEIPNTCGGGGTKYGRTSIIKAINAMDAEDVPEGERYLAMGPIMNEDVLNQNIGLDKDDEWFMSGKVTRDVLGFHAFKDKGIKQNYVKGV